MTAGTRLPAHGERELLDRLLRHPLCTTLSGAFSRRPWSTLFLAPGPGEEAVYLILYINPVFSSTSHGLLISSLFPALREPGTGLGAFPNMKASLDDCLSAIPEVSKIATGDLAFCASVARQGLSIRFLLSLDGEMATMVYTREDGESVPAAIPENEALAAGLEGA